MEKIKELKKQIKQNENKIKLTHCENILMSCVFIAIGIFACVSLSSSLTSEFSNMFVRWGFPALGITAAVMSNSWAIETIKNLKDENNKLKYEIEKEELTQQIKQLEAQRELQKELKQDFKVNKTITTNNQKIGNVALSHEELTR